MSGSGIRQLSEAAARPPSCTMLTNSSSSLFALLRMLTTEIPCVDRNENRSFRE
jgi:hypothetical protein